MSKVLIEKLRKARERTVTVDGRNYTIRRPMVAEAARLNGKPPIDWVTTCVVGWGLTEVDIDAGGTTNPLPFDAEVWAEWIQDQPDLWAPLMEAILNLYTEQRGAKEDAEKN